MSEPARKDKSFARAVFSTIIMGVSFVFCFVTFAVGFSLGWFNENTDVGGNAPGIGVDLPNVSFHVADSTGKEYSDSTLTWLQATNISSPLITFGSLMPGMTKSITLRITNNSEDDVLFYNAYLAVPQGGEMPKTVGENNYYLGTQLEVNDTVIVGSLDTAAPRDGFRLANTAETPVAANQVLAENLTVPASTVVYLTVSIRFVNAGNQDAYQNFGVGDNSGFCARYFELTY